MNAVSGGQLHLETAEIRIGTVKSTSISTPRVPNYTRGTSTSRPNSSADTYPA